LTAVDGGAYRRRPGDFRFGLNGAGKSATIKIWRRCSLTGVRATLAGYDVLTQLNEVRRSIDLVFQDPSPTSA
jgi:ABC-type multidrug transport system ATPase subunit